MIGNSKVALVIGWGSVKCAAALGLMRVLRREGVEIDLVVGCGAGSMYAAMLALGHDTEEIIAINQRLWTREVTSTPNRQAMLQLLLPRRAKVREYFNILDDRLVNERLHQAFGEKAFRDTKIPLYITTTEYKTGAQVVLSEGRIYEAVRASISLPLIFPPFPKDEHLLSDGYLSEPLPIGVALQEGAEIVFAMGFESFSSGPIHSFSDYLLHLTSIMSNNLLRASTAFYNLAHHGELISIIPQFDQEIHPFDTDRIPEIIQVGEAETEKHLPQIRSLLKSATE